MTGPLFNSNFPDQVVCGSTVTLVRTKSGHVYYWGRHRTVGEACMWPRIMDVLANNSHVVTHLGAGNMHLVCSTSGGATVAR